MKIKRIIGSLVVVGLFAIGVQITNAKDKEKTDPALLSKAKITKDEASKTALAKVPHGKIKASELEEEKGKLVWSFDIKVKKTKGITEVQVDAITGEVVSVEKETPADEAKEAAEDGKKK